MTCEERWSDTDACDVDGCSAPATVRARDGRGIVRFKWCADHGGPLAGPVDNLPGNG